MTNKPPGESFLKKYKVCTALVSQSIGSPTGAHAVTAATDRTGPDVVIPNFQKHFFHRKSVKHGLEPAVSLDAKNDCQIF